MGGGKLAALKRMSLVPLVLALLRGSGQADDYSFTNSLAQAALAAGRGDISASSNVYDQARRMEASHPGNLCVLARRYCDLACLTHSMAAQKALVAGALACSLQAVHDDSNSATAHACVAVAYARSCAFADIKTQLAYSRRFKLEAEKAIALDPRQDIAYYLLGRWNYEIASVGMFSRAYVRLVYGGLPKASYQAAIANFQKAIELAPDRILHHAGLAMACEAAGERQPAIVEWKRSRAMTPAGPEDQDAQREAVKQLHRLGL